MDTNQLESYMRKDPEISKYYWGVLPKDFLPLKPERPTLYVVNQDTSDKEGSHWIVIFIGDRKQPAEYFDPLGKEPDEDFKNYLIMQADRYMFNNQRCQNYMSNLCGHYCLFYCYFRARGYGMQNILNMFDKNDLFYNDQMVYFFYNYTK